MKILFAILTSTLLTGCLAEAPVQPIKVGMHAIPENETLLIVDSTNYFSPSDVHIVEAPTSIDMMPALRSGAIDGAVSSLAKVMEWSQGGIDLTIVAVINGSNSHSFPAHEVGPNGRRIDSEAFNLIAVRSDFLEMHPDRVNQLVQGWIRARRQNPEDDYNFTSYKDNKTLLLLSTANSLHAVIDRRADPTKNKPTIDGRFYDDYVKDAGERE